MSATRRPSSRQSKPGYRITPSLLAKWTDLVNADLNYEQFWGNADEPSKTPEEYYKECEQALLDACNRVPFVSEAASKGTALNELVDCLVDHRKQRVDMTVERVADEEGNMYALRAELEGFSFLFDVNLVRELAGYFIGATCQHRCEATIDTSFGPVILYGDADYIVRDVVYDLKTTSKYSAYGKFEGGWQKDLYPWALIESGEMKEVSGFEYTIVPLTGGTASSPLITGEIHTEYYPYNHDASTGRLRAVLEAFIQWIEDHRSLITHPRIFNQI